MNLFEKFEEVLASNILSSFKSIYTEGSGDSEKAINGIFYTMIAGLVRRSNSVMSTNMMVNQIVKNYSEKIEHFDFAKDGNKEKDILEMINSGQKSISQIFPAFKSPLLNLISTYAGTGKQETTGFTGYITSYLIQKLGYMIKDEGMSTDDLIYYLQQHRQVLFDKAPKELMDKMIPALGLQEISTMKVVQTKKPISTKSASNDEESISTIEEGQLIVNVSSQTSNRWLFLGLAIVALAILSYVIFQNKDELFGASEEVKVAESIDLETPVSEELLDSVQTETIEPTLALPIDEMKDSSKSLETIFELPMLSFSGEEVDLDENELKLADDLIELMNTNSRMQIQIIGNNSGQKDNIALKRAFSLKRYLLKKGLENIRIDAIAGDANLQYLQLKVISR